MTNPETWILFKTARADDPGWESRLLMPSESLTPILAEEYDWSGRPPGVGDRVRDYAELDDSGDVYGRDGDWMISAIQHFSSFDSATRIVVCLCEYQPVKPEWEKLNQGLPLPDMGMLAQA